MDVLADSYDRSLVPIVQGALAALPANPDDPYATLFVANSPALVALCHNQVQQAVVALPGINVRFVRGAITPAQVITHRPSYVNAILIQRAGILIPGGCSECRRRGFTPFPECRFVPGYFGDACGNCKWRDHAARCQHPRDDDSDNNSDDEDPRTERPRLLAPAPGPRRGRAVVVVPAYGSAANPIVL